MKAFNPKIEERFDGVEWRVDGGDDIRGEGAESLETYTFLGNNFQPNFI